MFHRSRVAVSLVAALILSGAGALSAMPAFASVAASTSIASSTATQSDSTDQQPLTSGTTPNVTEAPTTDKSGHETPVAERTTLGQKSLLMVAGLGVLFAAILVVVMSGSRSHVGRD